MQDTIAIKVENLSKVFSLRQPRLDEDGNTTSEHWALKDVSFEIKKGESVGIIGPNGSGKSTLLKILAGVTKPTSGKVSIRGKVASILDIGAGFHLELSGRENVFLNGQIHGLSKGEIEAKFDEIIAFSGIEKFIDEPVKNYSNGMYLRLAFSIMAHLDFDVYLLDEVLSMGDEEFRKKSYKRMLYLQSVADKCIITVSHNMWELKNTTRTFYIKYGEVDIGYREEIIKQYAPNDSQANLLINNPFFIDKDQYSKNSLQSFVDELNIYMTDDKGRKKDEFKSDEEITLVLDLFTIKQNINIGLVIKDRFNHPVIDISPITSNIQLEASQNKRVFTTFKKQWFNAGVFSIDIVFFNDSKVVYAQDDFTSFKINIEDAYKGSIYQYTWGALRPFLKWEETSQLNE